MQPNETPDQYRGRIAKRMKRSQAIVNLKDNPDFQAWKSLEIDVKLDLMRKGILETDTSAEGWKEKACADIQAYQAMMRAFDSCFPKWERINKEARDKLKELS